jgi:hypothetical protein
MTDLGVNDSDLNAKNLLRIRADVKQLVKEHAQCQRFADTVNVEIVSEGPSNALEKRLKSHVDSQHSACTRAYFAVSIIGLAIEDLVGFSRDPPHVFAINDLFDSLMISPTRLRQRV